MRAASRRATSGWPRRTARSTDRGGPCAARCAPRPPRHRRIADRSAYRRPRSRRVAPAALAGGRGLLLEVRQPLAVGPPRDVAFALLLPAASAAAAGGWRRLRVVLHAEVDGRSVTFARPCRPRPRPLRLAEAADRHVIGERLRASASRARTCVGETSSGAHHRREPTC